jgi:hypothetical protein
MPKRSSKRQRGDVNETAFQVVQEATEQSPIPPASPKKKNAAAVALGRLGGKKGGKARADRLSAERRAEIARQAAASRWRRQKGDSDGK